MIKKIALTLIFNIIVALAAFTNDGAFFSDGNHLTPIKETDILVKKEILTLKRVKTGIKVKVEYTFFNPKEDKDILVGFEAAAPLGDVDSSPQKNGHPYIDNFSVFMNAHELPYNFAIINGERSYKKEPEATIKKSLSTKNKGEDTYVYYFNAHFKQGENKIKHEYSFHGEASIGIPFSMTYILTAANRWAGGKIHDFTLIIEGMDKESFYMEKSFFKNPQEWEYKGKAKIFDENIKFTLEDDIMTFHKKDFSPKGELTITIYDQLMYPDAFDYKEHKLDDYSALNYPIIYRSAFDEKSYKILRNWPYAIRGYIFQTAYIQKYYESLNWYKPNPDYKADMSQLTTEEQDWLSLLNENAKW